MSNTIWHIPKKNIGLNLRTFYSNVISVLSLFVFLFFLNIVSKLEDNAACQAHLNLYTNGHVGL